MNFIILCAFVLLMGAVSAQDKFTSKYDNIDLDEILGSDRLLRNYFNCLMDKGSCTPDGKELKNSIPNALKDECSKCSVKHKEGTKKVLRFLIKNKPDMWKELEDKYDPEATYRTKFDEQIKKEIIDS